MTLTAANPGGWSLNEVLTSAQMTHLQNQLLNAIDGVNGGTYTLASTLTFMGQDVRIGADLEVLSTGQINLQSGAELNLLGTSSLDIGGTSILVLGASATGAISGEVNFLNGSALDIETGSILNVNSGGRFDVNSGGDFNVESGALFDLTGTLTVGSTGNINMTSSSNLNLQSGADLIGQAGSAILLQSGADLIGQAGAVITGEDAEDVVINDAPEGFRTTLIPFGFIATGWEVRVTSELVWEQVDDSSDWRIVFPIVVPPGDDLVDVFIAINGENGHADLPATMPRARLVRAALDGTFTVLATRIDPSASVVDYETPHYIVLGAGSLDSGTMPQTANADPLYVIVQGETGANALAGLEIGSITGNRIARSYRGGNAVFT